MPVTKIFIVDDHHFFVNGLLVHFRLNKEADVCGYCYSGEDAVRLLTSGDISADVVLLDFVMTGIDGIEVVRQLKKAGVKCKIIIISTYDSDSLIMTAKDAGADAFIWKRLISDKIDSLIKIIMEGQGWTVMRKVMY